MANITAPKGTADVLPTDVYKWHALERRLRTIAEKFDFKEVRFPTFEHTELFQRGVGDTTDVVQKEMYSFEDKGGRGITLRPEGTASVGRLVIEHGLYGGAMPLKMYYIIPCFRYEKPQAGRLREFHQFGIELFGAYGYRADCEVIAFGNHIFKSLGIGGISLRINSIGCKKCREDYKKALIEYYSQYKSDLCETCLSRMEKNPLRLLDCKSPVCSSFKDNAPSIIDYLCDDCRAHFDGVKRGLEALGIEYTVDPLIVRGLDYYNRTVFEFVSDNIGAQGTVLGGGRYDGLAEDLGGPALAGMGFGMGLERLLLLIESSGIEIEAPDKPDLYIASMGEKEGDYAMVLAQKIRAAGGTALSDINDRSFKAQMKYASKCECRYTAIIGESELESGLIPVKNMETGEQVTMTEAQIIEKFSEK